MSESVGVKTEEPAEESIKVKTTGLGAIFNFIKENKESLAEETKPDPTSNWDSVPLEQLCDVGVGAPKSRKSQRVSSYYCEICCIDLNSQVTYDSHVAGLKHQKKERNKHQINDVLKQEKTMPEGLKVAKKKQPVTQDFRKLISESPDPCIGLQYIIELFPSSNISGDFDAMYSCELCCTEGPCASVFAHVIGFKHKDKYLSMKYNLRDLDKADVAKESKRVEDLEGRRLSDIRTEFSDDKYPFPPGKRPPGAVMKRTFEETETGGEDLSFKRDFSRRGYDFARHQQDEVLKTSLSESKIAKVLTALQTCQVKSEEDADMAHQVSAHLIRALTDYKELTGPPNETRNIQSKCDQILDLLFSIRKIKSFSAAPEVDQGWKGGVVDYGHGQEVGGGQGMIYGGGGHNGYSTRDNLSADRDAQNMSSGYSRVREAVVGNSSNLGDRFNEFPRLRGGGVGVGGNNHLGGRFEVEDYPPSQGGRIVGGNGGGGVLREDFAQSGGTRENIGSRRQFEDYPAPGGGGANGFTRQTGPGSDDYYSSQSFLGDDFGSRRNNDNY